MQLPMSYVNQKVKSSFLPCVARVLFKCKTKDGNLFVCDCVEESFDDPGGKTALLEFVHLDHLQMNKARICNGKMTSKLLVSSSKSSAVMGIYEFCFWPPTLKVFSHQSKTTTRQRQDKCWTCAFLWWLSHQTCRTWCERHHRNAQVQHLSCRCLALVWKHHKTTQHLTQKIDAGSKITKCSLVGSLFLCKSKVKWMDHIVWIKHKNSSCATTF